MIQRENMVIGYRATNQEVAILDRKVKLSGLTRSEFLRRLVEQAEITPPQISFGTKDRRNAKVSQAGSVTAVR